MICREDSKESDSTHVLGLLSFLKKGGHANSLLDCFETKAFLLKVSFQNMLYLHIIVEKGRGLQGARGGHPCRKLASQVGEEGKSKKNKPKKPTSPTHLLYLY